MIEELRTAAEAVLEDQPPDPNAVELATLVQRALDAGLIAELKPTGFWRVFTKEGFWEYALSQAEARGLGPGRLQREWVADRKHEWRDE